MTKKTKPPEAPRVPPSLTGTDKRSTVLRAAHKLFLRDGYSETSMDAVTEEAGVSKATVYAHFGSKEALFEALVRDGSEHALKSLPPLQRRGGDPTAELRAFFEPFLHLLFEHGGYAWNRLVIAEALRHPENAELFYSCTLARVTASVEAYLGALAREGLLRDRDPRAVAEALLAVVLVAPMHHVLIRGPAAVDYRRSLHHGLDLLIGT